MPTYYRGQTCMCMVVLTSPVLILPRKSVVIYEDCFTLTQYPQEKSKLLPKIMSWPAPSTIIQIHYFHGTTPPVGQGLLIFDNSWSPSDTPNSVGLLWTSDRPAAGSLPDNTLRSQKTDIHAPAGFEPAIPASERPHTHRAATGTVLMCYILMSDARR